MGLLAFTVNKNHYYYYYIIFNQRVRTLIRAQSAREFDWLEPPVNLNLS